jgi:hypothetical protein
MFPFVDTVFANDNSIVRLRWLAGNFGIEHSDWTWEWPDGGSASFKFKDESQVMTFRASRLLLERSTAEWAPNCSHVG